VQPVSVQPVSAQPVSAQPVSAGPATPVAAPHKRFGGNILLRIAVALLVGVAVYLVKGVVFADRAKDARVGDCIAASTAAAGASEAAQARVVDCASADAAFTVAGRVDGETDTEGTHCDRFFADGETYLVFSSTAGGGYLLCLRTKR